LQRGKRQSAFVSVKVGADEATKQQGGQAKYTRIKVANGGTASVNQGA
jgi:hypothetical protein